MKVWHCTKCHHEWMGGRGVCDWCLAKGEELGEDAGWSKFREYLQSDKFKRYRQGRRSPSKDR